MSTATTQPAAASPDQIALGLGLIEQVVSQCVRNGARDHQIRGAVNRAPARGPAAEVAS